MSIGIYKIQNKVNNKVYIGQSIDIVRRFIRHKTQMRTNALQYPLYLDSKIYGLDNFDFSIIEECKVEELDEREKFWIKHYDSYVNGYNQTFGGSGKSSIVKISNEDLIIIISLLKESDITQRMIAEMFDIGEDTISEINNGKTRIQENISYPIRITSHKYYCEVCGKERDGNSKSQLCKECYTKTTRTIKRPEPLDLAKEILENGFEAIGRKYGVSGNAIKKWCKTYDIPHLKSELFQWYNEHK